MALSVFVLPWCVLPWRLLRMAVITPLLAHVHLDCTITLPARTGRAEDSDLGCSWKLKDKFNGLKLAENDAQPSVKWECTARGLVPAVVGVKCEIW